VPRRVAPADYVAAIRRAAEAGDSLCAERLRYLSDSRLFWRTFILPMTDTKEHPQVPPADFHQEGKAFLRRHREAILLAPPGMLKTTFYTIQDAIETACADRTATQMFVNIAAGGAKDMLATVQYHLAQNEKLIEVFGRFKAKDAKWAQDRCDIIGKPAGTTPSLHAVGLGGRYIGKRPHYIRCDDLEDSLSTATRVQRDKTWRVFGQTLLSRREATSVLWYVTTTWRENDLAHRLEAEMKWPVKRFDAFPQGMDGPSLYEEKWPRAALLRLYEESPRTFRIQRMNMAKDAEGEAFNMDWLLAPELWLDSVPADIPTLQSFDPAMSAKDRRGQSLNAAVLLGGPRIDGTIVLMAIHAVRSERPFEVRRDITRAWNPGRSVSEEIGMFGPVMRRSADGVHEGPKVMKIQHQAHDKLTRIQALEDEFRHEPDHNVHSRLRYLKSIRGDDERIEGWRERRKMWNLFLDEYGSFPGGDHLDILDALNNGIRKLLTRPVQKPRGVRIGGGR